MLLSKKYFFLLLPLLLLFSSAEAASHKWVAIFAKGTGYTDQAYDSRGDWRDLMQVVRERKAQGYEISSLENGGGLWFAVFTMGTSFTQSHLMAARNWDGAP